LVLELFRPFCIQDSPRNWY